MRVEWDDEVDALIAGDATAGFASVTPARGVVIVPMAPLGLRDRDAGTITITTSLGLPKKLERLRRNPAVAIAYHAREHGLSTSPLYVVAQGTASVAVRPDRAWLESITPQWERFLGPRHTGRVGALMDVYYWQRVAITISVQRLLVYDGPSPTVLGDGLPREAPAPQAPPGLGTGPRVDAAKVASHVDRLPHSLLGWVGADGLPVVTRATAHGADDRGVLLASVDEAFPRGGRRAGLTSHSFRQHMVGQEQRVHTGWLEVDDSAATYAPHTRAGYALPPSRALMAAASAVGTRAGLRKARRLGLVPDAAG